MSTGTAKFYGIAIGVFAAMMIASRAQADGPDISAQRLLESWKGEDPGHEDGRRGHRERWDFLGRERYGKARLLCFPRPQRGPDHQRLRGVLERQSEDGQRPRWCGDGGDAQEGVSLLALMSLQFSLSSANPSRNE